MLGLIHRTVLGCGPAHFASMFRPSPPSSSQKHCWHLQSHRGSQNLLKLVRSTLNLTDVCNLLPARVVDQMSVAAMQHELQCILKFRAASREDDWQHTFSPRVSLPEHPWDSIVPSSPFSRQQFWFLMTWSQCRCAQRPLPEARSLERLASPSIDREEACDGQGPSRCQARSAGGRKQAMEGSAPTLTIFACVGVLFLGGVLRCRAPWPHNDGMQGPKLGRRLRGKIVYADDLVANLGHDLGSSRGGG